MIVGWPQEVFFACALGQSLINRVMNELSTRDGPIICGFLLCFTSLSDKEIRVAFLFV